MISAPDSIVPPPCGPAGGFVEVLLACGRAPQDLRNTSPCEISRGPLKGIFKRQNTQILAADWNHPCASTVANNSTAKVSKLVFSFFFFDGLWEVYQSMIIAASCAHCELLREPHFTLIRHINLMECTSGWVFLFVLKLCSAHSIRPSAA